jgi:poly(A) polymerase
LTDTILQGSKKWAELFSKHDFFQKYKYYIQVITCSDSLDNQRLWSALVESRLRHFVLKLEFVENLEMAHPFIKGFDRVANVKSETEAIDVGRGIFPEETAATGPDGAEDVANAAFTEANSGEQLDIPRTPSNSTLNGNTDNKEHTNGAAGEENEEQQQNSDEVKYPRPIYTTSFYIGLKISDSKPGDAAVRKLDITWPARDFMTMCKSWETYNDQSMGISVRHIKNSRLPSDVFEEGEQRRMKRNKKEKVLVSF